MKKAVIIYNTKSGITKKFAEEIGAFLKIKELAIHILSIEDYKDEIIDDANYLFLGCWTSGLFLFMQHPNNSWKEFASKLPNGIKSKTALFTTYKMLTGSMFGIMRKYLDGKINSCPTELKSRNGLLSESDKTTLVEFIN